MIVPSAIIKPVALALAIALFWLCSFACTADSCRSPDYDTDIFVFFKAKKASKEVELFSLKITTADGNSYQCPTTKRTCRHKESQWFLRPNYRSSDNVNEYEYLHWGGSIAKDVVSISLLYEGKIIEERKWEKGVYEVKPDGKVGHPVFGQQCYAKYLKFDYQ